MLKKDINKPFYSLLAVIFIIFPLINFHFMLDAELMPRFFGWAIITFVFSIYFFRNFNYYRDIIHSFFLSKLFFLFLVYLLICLFSLNNSINFSEGVYQISKIILQIVFLLILTAFLYKNESGFISLLKFIHVAILIFALFGFYQFYLINTAKYLSLVNTLNPYTLNDVVSTLSNKNLYAEVLLIFLPFVVCGFVFFDSKWKWVVYLDIAIILSHIMILGSFAVLTAFLISFFVFFLLVIIFRTRFEYLNKSNFSSLTKHTTLVLIIIVLILASGTIIFFYSGSYQNTKQKISFILNFEENKRASNEKEYTMSNTVFDRVIMYRNSAKMFKEHPLFGVGLSNWAIINPKYGMSGMYYLNSGTQVYEHPHNDFLLVLTETGVFGLIAYSFIFLLPLFYIIKVFKNAVSDKERIVALLMFSTLTIYTIISFFSFPKQRVFHLIMFDVILAVVLSKYSAVSSLSVKKIPETVLKVFLFSSIILTLFIAVVGFYRLKGEIYFQKAIASQFQQRWNEMVRNIDKARSSFYEVDYTSTPLLWYRGLANFYANRINEAFTDFKNAEKHNPYHLHNLNNIASCYEIGKVHDQAIAYYQKALLINPYFNDALINLSIVYYQSGKMDEAYGTLSNFINKKDTKYQEVMTAILYYKITKLTESVNEPEKKHILENKSTDAKWLLEMNEKSKTKGLSFEQFIKENVDKNLVN